MPETKLTADLPDLRLEITRREFEDGRGEQVVLDLTARSGFANLFPVLPAAMTPYALLGAPDGESEAPTSFADPFYGLRLWQTLCTAGLDAMLAPWRAMWDAANPRERDSAPE